MADQTDKNRKQELEVNELLGFGEYVDSNKRLWRIKAFKLHEFGVFQDAISIIYQSLEAFDFDQSLYGYFLSKYPDTYQLCLQSPRPTIKVRLRRLLGKPDYKAEELANSIIGKDLVNMMDAIMHYNMNESLHEYFMGLQTALKKNKKKMSSVKDTAKPVAK